ncbi:hypothetical protein K501DRAFT_327408 [Backusella circina FSU 941]|nr:hypothetical protein K501DRAFT_327408 [Backusella circina FSU 941]
MSDLNEFDPFEDITNEEQLELNKRRQQHDQTIKTKINNLASDPLARTMAENRMIFTHVREEKYKQPIMKQHLLSEQECQTVLDICHKKLGAQWTMGRHSAFATVDIPIRDDEQLAYLEPIVRQRLFPLLATHYQFKVSDLAFRDIFLVKYSAVGQRGLKLHTDGCLFSLTLLISNEHDFQGGGTYYASTDTVLHLKQGDCAYHDAHIMHSGVDITQGERYILVAFIDTIDTIENDKLANKSTLRQ